MGVSLGPSVTIDGRIAGMLSRALADLPARYRRNGAVMPSELLDVLDELATVARAAATAQRAGALTCSLTGIAQESWHEGAAWSESGSDLGVEAVARLAGASPSTVRRAVSRGLLPARRAGRRTLIFDAKDVQVWLETR